MLNELVHIWNSIPGFYQGAILFAVFCLISCFVELEDR